MNCKHDWAHRLEVVGDDAQVEIKGYVACQNCGRRIDFRGMDEEAARRIDVLATAAADLYNERSIESVNTPAANFFLRLLEQLTK